MLKEFLISNNLPVDDADVLEQNCPEQLFFLQEEFIRKYYSIARLPLEQLDMVIQKAVAFNENGKQMSHLPERIEVGCGNINFPRIIKAAEAVGCKYFVVEEEIYSTGKSIDSIRISAENIKARFLEK